MRPVRMADNLTTFTSRLSWNLGASTSWNPQGLSRPKMGLVYLYLYITSSQWTLTVAHALPSVRLATWWWRDLDEFQWSDSRIGCGSFPHFYREMTVCLITGLFLDAGSTATFIALDYGTLFWNKLEPFYCNRVPENKLSASNVEYKSGYPLDSITGSPHDWIIGACCDYWQSYSGIS
jgi:hypothetical protein